MTDDVVDEALELFEDDLQEILGAARHQLQIARGDERDGREDHQDQPRVGHVVGNARQPEDRRMLDDLHAQSPSRAAARPRATRAHGRTVNPATRPSG